MANPAKQKGSQRTRKRQRASVSKHWLYPALAALAIAIIVGSWWVQLEEAGITKRGSNSVAKEELSKWTNATARRIAEDFTRGPFEACKETLTTLQSDVYEGYVGADVKLTPGGAERGLFASKSFAKGEVVMRIPKTAWYSQDDVPTPLASIIGISKLQEVHPEVQRVGIGFGLVYEAAQLGYNNTKGWLHNRMGKSKVEDKKLLKELFSSFPDTFDSVVRLNANQSAFIFEPAREELRRLERFLVTCRSLAVAMPAVFGIDSMETEEAQFHLETMARWAWGIVLSRTGVARVKEATGLERDMVLLLPAVSLINTAQNGWNLEAPECDYKACIIRARRAIHKGDELTIDYGLKSNLQFLLYGGFTIPGNKLGYPITLNYTTIGNHSTLMLLKKHDIFKDCVDPFIVGDDSDWKRILKCSRLAQYAEMSDIASLEELWSTSTFDEISGHPSTQDIQALRLVLESCQQRVDEITSKLSSANAAALLETGDPFNGKLIAVVRQELNAAVKWRDNAQALIELTMN